jgi:protein TonB
MVQGWSASIVLHLMVAFAAVWMVPKLTMVVQQEPFRWEVTLVEPSPEIVREDTPPPVAEVQPPKPSPAQPRPVEVPVETVMPRVAPQQSPQVIHPQPATPKPEQHIQPVEQIAQAETKPVEPQEVKKEVVKEPEPVKEEVATAIEPVAPEPRPHVVEPRPDPVPESPPSLAAKEPAPISPPPPVVAGPSESAPAVPPVTPERPPVVASLPPRPATKADYAWLAESLGRRVAALTHYPSTARMNGWEGRVVVRAVIRADGHLADAKVQKSSGYDALDRAALETIRLACPLHMKHALSTTEVAVNVPIVYSLSN